MGQNTSIFHRLPIPTKGMVILPFGKYFNKKITELKPGDRVIIRDSWRNEPMTVEGICRIDVKSSVFTFLLRALYGSEANIKDITEKWRTQSVLEGFGRHGFDPDECILVELR